MAVPMTAAQIKAQLTKFGVRFKEYENWATHNRGQRGDGWGITAANKTGVHGLLWHHTGSDSSDQRELLHAGTSALPGPLSQFGIAQDGTVWLIGWGRCNHAGLGDDDVFAAVRDETYGDYPPTDNETNTDGNARFYGVEIWYSGSHGMTPSQYEAALRLSAAIADFHGWNEKSFIAHGEWQPGKWDPGYASGKMMDMRAVRSDIKRKIDGGNVTAPVPGKDVEASKPTGYREVTETDAIQAPRNHPDYASNKFWTLESYVRFIAEALIRIEAK